MIVRHNLLSRFICQVKLELTFTGVFDGQWYLEKLPPRFKPYCLLVQNAAVVFDRAIVELPLEHPVFHVFYNIDSILQVPNLRQGWASRYGGATHEYDGIVPHVRGIFDDDGRLMVLINWNTDLGDAWEWADHPDYPLKFSTYAFEMGINFVIYAMTH